MCVCILGGEHAPRAPSSEGAMRPTSRPDTSSRPKTSSWAVSEDPVDMCVCVCVCV